MRHLQRAGRDRPRRREQLLVGAVAGRRARARWAGALQPGAVQPRGPQARRRALVPWAGPNDRIVIAYSPLAQGFLSGRYDETNVARRACAATTPLFLPQNLRAAGPLLETVRDVARAPRRHAVAGRPGLGHPPAQRGRHPGASSVGQLEQNVAAADLELERRGGPRASAPRPTPSTPSAARPRRRSWPSAACGTDVSPLNVSIPAPSVARPRRPGTDYVGVRPSMRQRPSQNETATVHVRSNTVDVAALGAGRVRCRARGGGSARPRRRVPPCR